MDREQVFDDDYLYFYETFLTDEVSDRQTELIANLLEIEPGMEVLDLACGHGRIANRLAARGVRVTGLDATPGFLELARRDAEARGVDVEYVEGDMRSLPWEARFDRVVCWFTSFGYFDDDDDNRRVLREAHQALKPDGRLLIENNNLLRLLREFVPEHVVERDGNLQIDRHRFDAIAGRIRTERIIVRDGKTRRFEFAVRVFTFVELREWLLAAGFRRVDAHDSSGEELSIESRRMITIAHR